MIGHDNPIWLDQLIVGKWHFAHQGLAIQRYSPHICGGTPVYGNPESLQYSLAQFLTYFMHPWWAMQICVVVALIVGYFGWLQFGKKVMQLKENWSQLLALVMIANGFIFTHLAVGHFQMHTMTFIGWFLFLLFDRTSDSKIQLFTRASAFALLAFYSLLGAGYNVLLFTAIAAALVLPFDLIFSANLKLRVLELAKRAALAGAFSLLLLLSKLVAVMSFMKLFPRVEGYSHMWSSTNLFNFIARSFWLIFPTRESIPGYGWDLHEKTIFLSPITWIGLLAGVYLLVKKKHIIIQNIKKSILVLICSVFTFMFLTQLAQGHGFLVNHFLTLPVVSSLRVASRFLFIFSLFVSMLSIYALAVLSENWNEKWKLYATRMGMILTIFSLATGFYAVREKLLLAENYDFRTMQIKSLDQINYEKLPVTEIIAGDTDFIRAGRSCHVELLKKNQPIALIEAETKLHYGGAFNLINPSCYQYPVENNCTPGDRIKIEDQENFENFSKGLPVTWKISTLQQVADYTSLFTFFAMLALFIYGISRKKSD